MLQQATLAVVTPPAATVQTNGRKNQSVCVINKGGHVFKSDCDGNWYRHLYIHMTVTWPGTAWKLRGNNRHFGKDKYIDFRKWPVIHNLQFEFLHAESHWELGLNPQRLSITLVTMILLDKSCKLKAARTAASY